MANKKPNRVLTGHEEIRAWAEERGAKPACVRRTGDGEIGMLRLEFPGAPNANDSNLEEIGWDDFFGKFDESGLALLVQDDLAGGGGQSNFNKLLGRATAAAAENGEKTSPRAQPRSGIAKGRGASRRSPTSAGSGAKRAPAKKSSRAQSPARKSSSSPRTAASKSSAAKKPSLKPSPKKSSAKAKKSAPARTSTKSAATRGASKTGNARSATAKKSTPSSGGKKKSTGSARARAGNTTRARATASRPGSAPSSGRRSR